jgi:hypothetical protein
MRYWMAFLSLLGCSGPEVLDLQAFDALEIAVPFEVSEDAAAAPALPLLASLSCPPPEAVCPTGDPDYGIYASYRKDFFLPNSLYDTELEDDPLTGGRFHIAAIAQASGKVKGVSINNTPVPELLSQLKMDWQHVWPPVAVAGEPLWFAFHSRDPSWDNGASATITIDTDGGTAVQGAFASAPHPVAFTFVTLSAEADTLLVHVANGDESPHVLAGLSLNGVELTARGGACVPDMTLGAGAQALWTIPLCQAPVPGSAWTLVAHFADLPPAVAVGRHLRPFFPIEAWQKGGDCPVPGSNDAAHELFTKGGLDTFYLYWGSGAKCSYDNGQLYNNTLPGSGTHVLVGDDFPWDDPPTDLLQTTEAIAGILTGDESDWHYVTDEGLPAPENKATKARKVWQAFPELSVYNGAMTSKHIGAFAGMTDIQGMDIYSAACAPHMFKWGDGVPLMAPFDFLRNARNNHMPWPTWLYAQGLGGWSAMPSPHEILIQGVQAIAAGAKGLMWFQVGVQMANDHPDSWRAITEVNWMVRALRPWLREGDVTGLARSDPETIAEAIRARDALVVPIITTAASQGPTDEKCLYFALGKELEEAIHWVLTPREVEVALLVPPDFTVADLFEVRPDGIVEVTYPMTVSDRTIHLSAIPLDMDVPARFLVFASSPGPRSVIAAALAAPGR